MATSRKRGAAAAGLLQPMKAKKPKLKPQVAKAVRSQIKRELRKAIEAKHFYWHIVGQSITNAGSTYDVTEMIQGTTDNERVGDEVRISSIQLKGHVYLDINAGAPDSTNVVRLIVFQWHLDSQTQVPAPSSVLHPADVSAGIGALARWNETNRHQFRVLVDRTFCCSRGGPNAHAFRYNLTKPTRTVKFNDGAIHGEEKIYVMLISDSSVITHPVVSMTSQLNYRDG